MKKITGFLLLAVMAFTVHAQIITSVAGNGIAGFSGDGGAATAAEFNLPSGVAFDNSGNMYIAVRNNDRVRKVNSSGLISTVAGGGSSGLGDGGQASAAQLNTPYDVALDASGNIYIADASNARIRKVTASTGVITTIAGNGHAGYTGDGGPGTAAELNNPLGVAVDASGNVYVAEQGNSVIRMISTSGTISTFAGNGVAGYAGDNGPATAAEIRNPYTVTVDVHGNVYVADKMNYRVRKVTAGTITTIAGNGTSGNNGNNGQATAAELTFPTGVIADPSGIVYVVDGGANRVRKISTSGVITSTAGGVSGYSGDGGQATTAELSGPMKVAFDNVGNLYITDQNNNRIREVYLVLAVTTTVTANVSCNGGSNGSASASASDGTIPYTYSWSGGQSGSSVTGLSAGTYTVDVTDADGVTGSATVTISQPGKPLTPSASATATVTCYGGSNGSVSVTAFNGTSPYTYAWSPGGQTTTSVTGLSAGTYTATVTDNHGCTATTTATVIQPAAVKPIIAWTRNLSCSGAIDGMADAVGTGGTPPYTFSWSPSGNTNALLTGLSAGSYSITVTDINGCTGTASTNITQPPVLRVSDTNIASIVYALVSGGVPPYTYSWVPGGSTSSFATGISAGTYTVTVTDANSCVDTTVVHVETPLTIPGDSVLRFPRWDKRGVYLEFACHYYTPIHSGDSILANGTPFITYCRKNHITYVLLDGVDYNPGGPPFGNSCGVFYQDSAFVNATNAPYLENFIDSLKTRGGVEQVGVICYQSDPGHPDSNSYSIKNFNVANFTESARMYNVGLPWRYKIDYLSLDYEDWIPYTTPSDTNYSESVSDFLNVHLPMLRSMWAASRNCDANFIRTEDFISPPLDINFYLMANPPDSVLYTNKTQSWMIDSIAKWADRIQLGSYTYYAKVLWNRGDWMQADSEIGRNPLHAFYKKEVWPVFSVEDTNNVGSCAGKKYYIYPGDDYSGHWMCNSNITPDSLEQCYYRPFSYSMEHYIFTDDNLLPSQWHHMLGDTCFKVEGNMWYDGRGLELWQFDTNEHTNAIHFQVSLGHDTLWTGGPIKLIAKPDGGLGTYYYIWYDEDRHDTVVQGISTNNTYIAPFPGRYEVLAIDAKQETAMDYVCIYKDTCGPTGIQTIERPLADFRIYPNPSHGEFTVMMMANFGKAMNLDVYNLMGQSIKHQEISQKYTAIDLSREASGVYFCRFTDTDGRLQKSIKLIVIH